MLWYCYLKLTINQNVFAFALMRYLCSFATSWKALHVLFELKQLAECRSRAADKLVVFAECKPRPADKLDGLTECESRVTDKSGFADGSRAAGKIELADGSRAAGKVFWELLVAAIGCYAKDSSSDFYPGIAHENLLTGQEPLARYFGNYWLQQLAAPLKIPSLIIYRGIAHKVE
jgi:hypothetical protein